MKYCPFCKSSVQHWGTTRKGSARFFCPECKRTITKKKRLDVRIRHQRHEMDLWLGGKDSLKEISTRYHSTRQTFWKHFRPFMSFPFEPQIPKEKMKMLILDATYIHKNSLCALVAIDENDRVFWRFAKRESYLTWCHFLSDFPEPEILVMDGQKGLFAAAKILWPDVKIQRCQFHVVCFAMQYLGRHPKDEAAKEIQKLLYGLKEVKTQLKRDAWIYFFKMWERKYDNLLKEKSEGGYEFKYQRLKSVRFVIRKALPHLFTYIDNPGTPNTTNLVEGWVNAAVAEAIRLHRGLKDFEKKTLVAIVLSKLRKG